MNDREAVANALLALGDQIQALCQNAPFEIAAFVLFSQASPMEYRSPHARAVVVEHLRIAADELEQK